MSTSASTVRIAASPVGWGVDFADSPSNPPWEKVLDDIQSSGVGALETGSGRLLAGGCRVPS